MISASKSDATLGGALDSAAARLQRAGVARSRRDARLLLAAALGAGPELLVGHPERSLSAAEAIRFDDLVSRRAAREPLSRILGRREFWGLEFRLSPAVLDPRPDSETLIEALLEALPQRGAELRILDLGTGSGCLLLALLSELPGAEGLGIDISRQAVAEAAGNAAALGLDARARFRVGDWCRELDGAWDVIVCNPPYIAEPEIAGLEPEVADHDPRLALAGGPDGLAAFRALVPAAARILAPAGVVGFEVGIGQADAVAELLGAAGFATPRRRRDLGGVERCLLAGKK